MMSGAAFGQAFPSGLTSSFPSSLFQSSLDGLPSFLQPSVSQYSFPYSELSPSSVSGLQSSDYSTLMPDVTSILGSGGLSSSLFGFPSSLVSDSPDALTSQLTASSLMGLDMASLMPDSTSDDMNQIISSAQPSSVDNYTESSNGKTIYIKLGNTIHVQLTSRVDQGLLWNVSVTNGLNITGNRMYPPVEVDTDLLAGVVGFEATQEWDIQAIAAGTQEVNGICNKSGNSTPVEDTYELTVVVSD